ncbi:iron-sulfur cluster-binding protein, Rieske family [Burkholderia pseudomallei]|nr:iron-sulfur cluster-binding protein, Rieske family [Burkholderia pseudomallei]OMR33696.1 iron-sulfur cluster-binding protein, Rieske family [Burkholderia pseudomallei]
MRFTCSVVTKRGWGGRARLGRRSARIAVRRGELCVMCGYADAVGGAAALFRTASRRSAAMRRAGRRDARAAYLRSSTTKS